MDYIARAQELFEQKFHCSQSVIGALAPDLGLPEETALKLGGCFGSGMFCGEVCGAVVGSLMAIGLKFGQSDVSDLDSRMKTMQKTSELIEKFKKENGSILCRELLGYNTANPDELKIIREKQLFSTFCPKIVKSAVQIAEKLLSESRL